MFLYFRSNAQQPKDMYKSMLNRFSALPRYPCQAVKCITGSPRNIDKYNQLNDFMGNMFMDIVTTSMAADCNNDCKLQVFEHFPVAVVGSAPIFCRVSPLHVKHMSMCFLHLQ